ALCRFVFASNPNHFRQEKRAIGTILNARTVKPTPRRPSSGNGYVGVTRPRRHCRANKPGHKPRRKTVTLYASPQLQMHNVETHVRRAFYCKLVGCQGLRTASPFPISASPFPTISPTGQEADVPGQRGEQGTHRLLHGRVCGVGWATSAARRPSAGGGPVRRP